MTQKFLGLFFWMMTVWGGSLMAMDPRCLGLVRSAEVYAPNLSVLRSRMQRARELLPIVLDQAIWHFPLSPEERDLAIKIHAHMPLETAPLEFVSFGAHPDRFAHLGPARTAATGSRVGDVVYNNLDLIHQLTFEQGVGLLVHEYGHHHGVRDEEARLLDTLGVKVASYVNFEDYDLSAAHLPNIRVASYHVKNRPTYFFHERNNRAVIGKWAHWMDEDYGYGTHLMISDGTHEVDLRQMFRENFSKDGRIIEAEFWPKAWRLDEVRGLLVLKVDATFNSGLERQYEFEVQIPLHRATHETWNLASDQKPTIIDLNRHPEWFDYVRREFFLLGQPEEILARDVELQEKDGVVRVSLTIDERPAFYLQPYIYWGQVTEHGGEHFPTLLPSAHSLSLTAKVVQRELIGAEQIRLTLEVAAPEPRYKGLKLLGVMMAGSFQSAKRPNERTGRLAVPEFLPTLAPNLETQGQPGLLRHVGGEDESHLLLPIESYRERRFDLKVEVPDDFPIRSEADFRLFDKGEGGMIRLLLENPEENYRIWFSHPTKIGKNAFVHLRDHSREVYQHPEFGFHESHPRVINLPLRLELSESLYLDLQHQNPQNTHRAPKHLKIVGLLFQASDLRSWELSVNVDVTFDHGNWPPVPEYQVIYSREAEEAEARRLKQFDLPGLFYSIDDSIELGTGPHHLSEFDW